MCVCRRFPGAVSAGDVRRRLPSDADGIRTRPVRQAGRRRYLASLPSLPRPDNFIVIAMLVVVVVVILLFATFPTFVCDKMECVLTTTCLHMSRKAHIACDSSGFIEIEGLLKVTGSHVPCKGSFTAHELKHLNWTPVRDLQCEQPRWLHMFRTRWAPTALVLAAASQIVTLTRVTDKQGLIVKTAVYP